MAKHRSNLFVLGFLGLVLACGSDDEGPTEPVEERMILANPSFATNIQEIFVRRGCTGGACHGDAQRANLDLRANAAFANLVNVPATQDPQTPRVAPGDPDGSYLVIKLEGRQTVGAQMPFGQAPLDAIDLGNIRNWISQGAQNN